MPIDHDEDEFLGIPEAPEFPNPPALREYESQYDSKYGHYILPDVTGKPKMSLYPRATTVAKALDDQTNLERWKMRQLLLAVKQYPGLMGPLDDIDMSILESDKHALDSRLDRIVRRALAAVDSGAANFGTAVHNWAWAVEIKHCTLQEVPEVVRGHVASYIRALERENIKTAPGMFERVVYNADTDSAGTLDRIYVLPDGTWVIGDIKTSSNISWSWLGIGAQLAQYANALYMLSEDGTRWEEMPEVSKEVGIVAHVPANPDDSRGVFCDLIEVNMQNGTHVMSTSAAVRAMRREARTAIPNRVSRDTGVEEAQEAPTKQRSSSAKNTGTDIMSKPLDSVIREAIHAAATPEQMDHLFTQYEPWWTQEYTDLGWKCLKKLGYSA